MSLRLYEMVRVRRLLRAPGDYDGWRVNQRPPRVGDCGAIVEIRRGRGLPDRYVVEAGGPGGVPVWLADFVAEELEPCEAGAPADREDRGRRPPRRD
jgi:hypothetical protein